MSKKNEKNFIDQMREADEKERASQDESERIASRKREETKHKQQEEYNKRLQQEKIELIRLKQGVIEQSELVVKEEQIKKVYTTKEKISNFFYHNKMWVIICSCVAVVFGFLAHDYLTTVQPDVTVLIVAKDYNLSLYTDEIENVLQKYATDVNGDGKVSVSVEYSPVTKDNKSGVDAQTYQANMTRLIGELQAGQSMLIISDNKTAQQIGLGEELENLTDRYTNKDNVNESGILLTETKLCEKIGDTNLPKDFFIGIRTVAKGTSYEKEMQKNYDESITLLDKFMKELG